MENSNSSNQTSNWLSRNHMFLEVCKVIACGSFFPTIYLVGKYITAA